MSRTTERPVPLWVVGLGLVFWGWQASVPALCFPLLVLALAPLAIGRRFDFGATEFHRALDVCWVLTGGGLLLAYGREPIGGVLREFARWLPIAAFPALMAQIWSARGRIPVSALIPLPGWRRQVDPRTVFDGVPVFAAVCLLAASVSGASRPVFYPGVVLVAGAACWSVRATGIRPMAAGAALGVAMVLGWLATGWIGDAQQWVEGRVLTMVSRWRGDEWSHRSFQTAIGRTGNVGGSSRVVLKMRGLGQGPWPKLLRVGVYMLWRGDGAWMSPRGEPTKVEPTGDEWRFDERPGREGSVQVEWVSERTSSFLPLPSSTRVVSDLPASRVARTPLGAVRADLKAGVVSYRADYGPDANWEMRPTDEDTRLVVDAETPGLEKFSAELGLSEVSPAEQVRRISEAFERRFRYTTELKAGSGSAFPATAPIGRFLHETRAGHCEYFATASTLLLRRLGVPARYATGYLVAAAERNGDTFLVRERQAHAWVRVWLDGAWQDFDPTPAGELGAESSPSGFGPALGRWISDLQFAISRWWWLGEKRWLRQAYWLAVPLLAGLLWRLRRLREASESVPETEVPKAVAVWPGRDSEWFAVAERLEREGWMRRGGEPVRSWWVRLARSGWSASAVAAMAGAYGLHQRLRFDPRGLDPAERERLKTGARQVLDTSPPRLSPEEPAAPS